MLLLNDTMLLFSMSLNDAVASYIHSNEIRFCNIDAGDCDLTSLAPLVVLFRIIIATGTVNVLI